MSFKKNGERDLRYKIHKTKRVSFDQMAGRGEVSKKLYNDGYPTIAIPLQVQLYRTLQDIQTYLAAVRHA